MKNGSLLAHTAQVSSITPALLQQVFDMPMEMVHTETGRPVVFVP